jgi:hypothetical protein
MIDRTEAPSRPFVWPVVAILVAPALLAGQLFGSHISDRYGGFSVFGGMEREIAATLEPIDFLGVAKMVRDAMESVNGE